MYIIACQKINVARSVLYFFLTYGLSPEHQKLNANQTISKNIHKKLKHYKNYGELTLKKVLTDDNNFRL